MMFGSFCHLLFLFWFMHFQAVLSSSSFNLSYPPPAKKLCSPEQSFALLHFKNSLFVDEYLCDYPVTNAWKENRDCCSWDGVTCDTFTGHVIGLNLSSSCLFGTIDDNSSLFLLHHLQKLNLADNYFYGSHFSSKFGEFRELTHLNLSSSMFECIIPVEISHLSKLVSLDLSSHRYYDNLRLPQESFSKMLQNLTELRYLHLDSVNLSSVDPGSLVNLSSSLISLSLEHSGLQGRFPDDVFHLPFLQRLCLSGNDLLTGNLPNSNWSGPLELLDLTHTSFSGEIPETIGSLKYLNVLNLSGTSFSGELPETIGSLKYVNVLDLSHCNFTGSIPASFWNLTRIISLDLSSNDFTGQIPTSICNLGELTRLELNSNTFSGHLPDAFGNLSKLTLLSLSSNNFSGQLPSSVFSLTRLRWLLFEENRFTGDIPCEVSGLSSLITMDFSHNFLSGRIPFWLFTLPFVESIYLQNNRLAGQIPSSKDLSSNNLSGILEPGTFSMLQNLQVLDLSHNGQLSFTTNFSLPNLRKFYCTSCNLTDFPIFLRNTESLELLDLSHNSQLSFTPNFSLPNLLEFDCSSCNLTDFPIFLRNTEFLEVLDLSNNRISGQISLLKLGFWPRLQYLDLSRNHLTSFEQTPPKIEQLLSLPTSFAFFSVSNNKLSGQIPLLFCNLSHIGYLVLSNNGLSGTTPPCLGKNNQLSHLDLRMNNLQGNIPQSLAMSHIKYLNLNGNQLKGPLPRSFDNCSSFEVLDVGNNNISDIFPCWLASLPKLQVLVLRSNSFHGPIGFSNATFSFSELRILDLSNNLFNGHLPTRYFDRFKAMMQSFSNIDHMAYMGDSPKIGAYMGDSPKIGAYMGDSPKIGLMNKRQREITYATEYYSMTLVIKGVQRQIERVLTTLTVLDLSNNLFEGGIPKVLGKLNALKALNFSHNKFTGHIPSSLENLTELESLDLSSNKLSGEIPKELTSLTYLSMLNLSFNQLVGPIPGGKQFNTFENDSFEGNLELCGLPLSKKCGFEWVPPTFDEEDNTSSWFDWKVAMMGYGCGLVIGLSMGYIVFAIRKPQWLIRIVERKQLTKAGRFSRRFRGIRNW